MFSIKDLKEREELSIPCNNFQNYKIEIIHRIVGQTQFIIFQDKKQNQQVESLQNLFQLDVNQMMVSLIIQNPSNNKNLELNNIVINCIHYQH